MPRFKCICSYDGTDFCGWQSQPNGLSVQDFIEKRLFAIFKKPIRIHASGRTDAGVHAVGQRAHFDTYSRIPPEKYPFALNTCLPPDIRVLEGVQVPGTFHARFDAAGKRYTYRIHNAPHASALWRNVTAHVPQKLDVPKMRQSLTDLLGIHDFRAFQAAGGTAKTTVRTLTQASLEQNGSELTLTVCGNAFLYNMVRIIAGTLIDIGMGRLDSDAFARALHSGNRLDLGVTAPACGLELSQISYPNL